MLDVGSIKPGPSTASGEKAHHHYHDSRVGDSMQPKRIGGHDPTGKGEVAPVQIVYLADR
jgi:hypothetical protein